MQLNVTADPPAWTKDPGVSYETKFLYTGFGRIDIHAKVYQTFQDFSLFERPFKGGVISRVYSTELATVTEYSKSPRRWMEETPGCTMYFAEISR
jgi:hypothetical protein